MKQCVSCHGQAQQFSSLRVDSREALLKGGNRGPAIIPGDSSLSILAKAVRHEGLKMPMGGKLAAEEIAAIEKWINLGAPWPSVNASSSAATAPGFYEEIKKEHWAFQPLPNDRPSLDKRGRQGRGTRPCCDRPLAPSLEKERGLFSKEPAQASHLVDRFVVAALTKAGLKTAEPADRRTLIRRVSLVLTGLPPTPLEVELFVRDESPEAYPRLVDRLLASPHFGERWARHSMDVMRFAETFGNDWNYEIKGAWLYRDYLIRAFNQEFPLRPTHSRISRR
ncbi:MAG: DUF1549 domain-containing protein [Acidobacteria bacterium]|nr:DUF1549 domain-containing protein [Acidobacteriota bacterium]